MGMRGTGAEEPVRRSEPLNRVLTAPALLIVAAVLVFAQPAVAEPPTKIFDGHGDIACATQGPGEYAGQTWCGTNFSAPGNVSSSPGVGGVPIDLNVGLPAAGDPPYPVVMVNHGNGQQKFNFELPIMQHWLNKGYAVYSQTARGFGYTCLLNPDDPGCEDGYSHLMDFRYEVRDAQDLLGILADEGIIHPTRIATTGGSYGGGMSMSLAALKNRVMDLDGTLRPWKSPDGKPMEIAVAAPLAPWTDFGYAIAPNGNAVDYIQDAGYFGPTGVMKESYVQGLIPAGRYAPAGTDPQADVKGWQELLQAGEPYDDKPATEAMRAEVSTYHSSYGLPPVQAPAPMFIVSGFTDDIFPVDEATRFYNRTRALFPEVPIGLFFGSLGHPRGQFQANVGVAYSEATDEWVDYYLGGSPVAPSTGVTTYTQTCPDGKPAAGPYTSPDWASIAPGEIRLRGGARVQTIDPEGGDFAVAGLFNPLSSLFQPPPAGTACALADGAPEPGSVSFQTGPAPPAGYTVMGATTVIAQFGVSGDTSQVAARLVDVTPDGSGKTLVSRGLWRPAGSGFQVFQLFANGWKVEPGHRLRLELLPRDSGQAEPNGPFNNYGRPSNDQQPVAVRFVDLRIPVVESPGALGGLVKAPARRVLPDRPGVKLAKGNEEIGSIPIAAYARFANRGALRPIGRPVVSGRFMRLRLRCPARFSSCARANLIVRARGPLRGYRTPVLARRRGLAVRPGTTRLVALRLSRAARKIFRHTVVRNRGKVRIRRGVRHAPVSLTVNGERAGTTIAIRRGRVR